MRWGVEASEPPLFIKEEKTLGEKDGHQLPKSICGEKIFLLSLSTESLGEFL